MSDLIIEIWDKVKQSYKTQSSVLTGRLSNAYVRCPVDITSLIKEVVINPYSNVDSDMREIQALNNEFGLSAPVKQSIIKLKQFQLHFSLTFQMGERFKLNCYFGYYLLGSVYILKALTFVADLVCYSSWKLKQQILLKHFRRPSVMQLGRACCRFSKRFQTFMSETLKRVDVFSRESSG